MDLIRLLPVLDPLTLGAVSAASAGLLLVFFLFLYHKERDLAGSGSINLDSKSPRWIEKKVQELNRVEAYRLAGDLKAHLKQWPEAAELYEKGDNLKKAAQSHLASGQKAAAAQAYLKSEDFRRAASLFMEVGDFTRAAEALKKDGDPLQAARVYERGGHLVEAAEIYLDQGLYRRAGRSYAGKEQWSRAADAMWRAYGQERARLPEEVAPAESMPLRHLAREAGDLFLRADRVDEAVEAYRAGSWMLQCAEALEEAGRFEEAAGAYAAVGNVLKAAESFEQAGEQQKAAQLRARFHLDKGREREALTYLETAGEYKGAAALHRKFEAWIPAGENFEKAGEFAEAAAMFERAGEYERAARALDKAGNHLGAAALYGRAGNFSAQAESLEKGGEHLAAGKNYSERGLPDKAITVLQRIEAQHPHYREASLLLGQIFQDKGMLELALEYFRRATRDLKIERSNLPYFYHLAVCAERMGKVDEAAEIYDQVLVLDFHYRDASSRLGAIKASRTVVDAPTPSQPARGQGQADTVAKSEATVADVPTPTRQSRYDLVEEVGRGGMGIVYKAKDTILERTVAFKVLPGNLKDHPQALRNFFREAKSAARLNHPNIVTVYDAGEESGTYYIAMEYVEGETIKQILNREGPLHTKAILVIAGQICKALEYAHERRIVHRDIKSSNIMWTPDKQVKLMDFGLAKVIEEVKGYQTIASGTPYYMSPEQILGRNIDHRTDIYSLGVTMFEMTTGRLPFIHGDATYHHVHTPPPRAVTLKSDTPAELSDIIFRCMQKLPDERFQNAGELFASLKKAASG